MTRTWLSPTQRRRRNNRWRWCTVALIAGYLLCRLIDRPVVRFFYERHYDEQADWSQLFRSAGFLPAWVLIGLALALVDWPRAGEFVRGSRLGLPGGRRLRFWAGGRRAVPLVLSAGLAGLAAEVLKHVFSRPRPFIPHPDALAAADEQGRAELLARVGEHSHHWPLTAVFGGVEGGLGLPSSHAAVAFAAAFSLLWIAPRVWLVALFVAVGCAWTRLASTAHFLTDVYVAAVLAYAVSWAVCRRLPPGGVREGLMILDAARGRGPGALA